MKNREFDNILNDCLERLLVKGETIEQCLQSYPEQVSELKPLLETALAAREASAIQPRPDFKARARYQFTSALKEIAPGKSRPFWGWFPRWATAVIAVLVLVLVAGGTVIAADSSMPDSPLYSVKLATEQVRLNLTPSQMGKVRLCAELADRRVAEIAYMANRGDAQQVEIITQRLDEKLELLVVLIEGGEVVSIPGMLMAPPPEEAEAPPPEPPPPEAISPEQKVWGGDDESARAGSRDRLRNTLVSDAASNRATLRAALDDVPDEAKSALRRAIAVSESGYEEVLEALEDEVLEERE